MLKRKAKKKYVANKGYECPYCGYDNRFHHGEPLNVAQDGQIEQKVRCTQCGNCWMDEYQLVKVHELAPDAVAPPKTKGQIKATRRGQDDAIVRWCEQHDVDLGQVHEFFWERFFDEGDIEVRKKLLFMLHHDPAWKCNTDRDAAAVPKLEPEFTIERTEHGLIQGHVKPQSTPSEVPVKKGPRPLCACGSPMTEAEQENGKCRYCMHRHAGED